MTTTASTITIIIAVCGVTTAVTLGAVKLLADSLRGEIGELRNEMRNSFADVRTDLRELRGDVGHLRDIVVREHGERITRLEERL